MFASHFVVPLILCLIIAISLCDGQRCRAPGESCGASNQCCGGCCIRSKCISTFRDCAEIHDDPCTDFYCPADTECVVYQPSCAGCEAQKECLHVDEAHQDHAMKSTDRHGSGTDLHHLLIHSGSSSSGSGFFVAFLILSVNMIVL